MHFNYRFGHQSGITSIDALSRERAVTSGGFDKTVRIWKIVEESQLIFNGHEGNIDVVKLLNDDNFLSCGDDGQLCLWGCMKKKPLCVMPKAHGTDDITGLPLWISSIATLLNTDLVASGKFILFHIDTLREKRPNLNIFNMKVGRFTTKFLSRPFFV